MLNSFQHPWPKPLGIACQHGPRHRSRDALAIVSAA
jgi:hypothetical protein